VSLEAPASVLGWTYPPISWWQPVDTPVDQQIDNNVLWQEIFFGLGEIAAATMIRFAPPGGEMADIPLLAASGVMTIKQAMGADDANGQLPTAEANFVWCAFCKLAFGSTVTVQGRTETVARNSRNPMYCDSCNWLIETYPGHAAGSAVVLAVDMEGSSTSRELGSDSHRQKLLTWKHGVAQEVHKHYGFIHSSIADHAIAVWFPGFLPPEVRERGDALQLSAKYALKAARRLRDMESPVPYRMGLDTSGDIEVFANRLAMEMPIGPVFVDIFGEAVEVATDIADNKPSLPESARFVATTRVLRTADETGSRQAGLVSRHQRDAWML
jgi:hypothetical protein